MKKSVLILAITVSGSVFGLKSFGLSSRQDNAGLTSCPRSNPAPLAFIVPQPRPAPLAFIVPQPRPAPLAFIVPQPRPAPLA